MNIILLVPLAYDNIQMAKAVVKAGYHFDILRNKSQSKTMPLAWFLTYWVHLYSAYFCVWVWTLKNYRMQWTSLNEHTQQRTPTIWWTVWEAWLSFYSLQSPNSRHPATMCNEMFLRSQLYAILNDPNVADTHRPSFSKVVQHCCCRLALLLLVVPPA